MTGGAELRATHRGLHPGRAVGARPDLIGINRYGFPSANDPEFTVEHNRTVFPNNGANWLPVTVSFEKWMSGDTAGVSSFAGKRAGGWKTAMLRHGFYDFHVPEFRVKN